MLFFPTVDEDFQYFRSQGYAGSINDMHFKAMGDLGYTGSLNDRIHAYLTFKYGSFYEAMRDLRNGTSVFAERSYIINGFDPALVLDFKKNYFRKSETNSTFAASITHARASSATMVNSSGTLVTVGNNVPRTGHHLFNGSAWVNEGILHESQARTNLMLNSGTLSTQSATVAAVPNTFSFTGTGTVTLTGVSTAGPLVGTGTGENNRVSLTFTPTAGTLTLSVSGTVTNAQLEAGLTPSSYIPTAGATVTRAAETLTVPAANLPYDSTNMSIQMQGKINYVDVNSFFDGIFFDWNVNSQGAEFITLRADGFSSGNGNATFIQKTAGTQTVVQSATGTIAESIFSPFNLSSRHGSTFINGAVDGTALTANTTPTALPDLSATNFKIGTLFNGTISKLRVWDEDLTDTGIATASAPTFTTEFAMTVATTGANETFTIPCQNVGTFNAGIEWGDGSVSTVTAYNDAELAHTYAIAGSRLIRITGSFPNIHFNNGGDKLKLKSVHNLGTVGWTSLNNAFFGCSNMTSFTAGTTDTSAVTNMAQMFRNCSSLTNIIGVENFNIQGLNSTGDLTDFMTSVTLNTVRYNALLINWNAQAPFNNMAPNFGNSKYTGGGTAAAARANLISNGGWTITDGGVA